MDYGRDVDEKKLIISLYKQSIPNVKMLFPFSTKDNKRVKL